MSFHLAPALSLAVERLFGYPPALQGRIGHPVQWMGIVLDWLEAKLYKADIPPHKMKERGIIALAGLILIAAGPAWLIAQGLETWSGGWMVNALLATAFIAQKSLKDHVEAVARALAHSLPAARQAVSLIVGRNPEELDESGIACAALESLAENSSDGIIAPFFWYVVAGLPGIVAYKAINTADSMIGHKNQRYRDFGWAAARLDDVVNLPASRLTGLLFAAAAALRNREDGVCALTAMRRDARKHRSPNAGWPEAALAGALGLSLGGPRSYGTDVVNLPRMGDGRRILHRDDIARGLLLYRRMLSLLFLLSLLGGLLF